MTVLSTPSARAKTRWLRLASTGATLLFLSTIIAPVTSSVGTASEEDADAAALVASIDVERMMGTIADLEGFGSREFHLESSRQAAEYLYDEFEGIGVSVELQEFMVGDANVSNVVATIQGTDEGAGTFLLGAHYDSENFAAVNLSVAENITAPGADDDASGVAAVLEIARVIKGSSLPATVEFVLFGAEESGYDHSGGAKGSEWFVATKIEAGGTYTGTVIMDMIGYRAGDTNEIIIVVNEDGCPLAGPTSDAVGEFGIDLSVTTIERPDLVYSDHSSFWERGIPSMLVIEELGGAQDYPVNPFYHSSLDISLFLTEDQLEAVTQAVLGGLLLCQDDDGQIVLIFGTVIMLVAIVSVALFIHFRRRKDRDGDDR